MTTFPFSLEQDGLIVVEVCLNLDYIFPMVLDTGYSHTVLHTREAQIMGFNLKKSPKTTIDTGSKPEYAKEILIEAVEALGCIVEDLTITVFDVNIERMHYVGYLGLDFLKGKKLFIDFEKQEVCIL